jgi:transposase-like protein
MQTRSTIAVTGLALAMTMACAGAKTDRPVVTNDDGKSQASPSGTQMAKEGKSLVRLVNAIPAKKGIDVSGGDLAVFNGVDYKSVTPYAEVRNNVVNFRLRAAGTDSALANNNETMTDGYRYTIVALPGAKGEPQMRVLRDEVVTDSGKARIRVINAAPDIGSIDVAMQGQKDPLFTNVKYGSEAGYKDIDPTSGTIDIRSDIKTRKPLQIKNMRFEAGKAYTIVLAGWGTGGIDAITFDDVTGSSLSFGK